MIRKRGLAETYYTKVLLFIELTKSYLLIIHSQIRVTVSQPLVFAYRR